MTFADCVGRMTSVRSEPRSLVGLLLAAFLSIGSVGSVGATGPDGSGESVRGESCEDPLVGISVAGDHEIDLFRGKALGTEAKIVTAQDLEGVVSGNVIEGTLTTGEVSIAPEAFSHFDGISSVIVNSGNNVSIQSSMVVNVTVEE